MISFTSSILRRFIRGSARIACHWLLVLLISAVIPGKLLAGEDATASGDSPVEICLATTGYAHPVIEVTGLHAEAISVLKKVDWDVSRWQQLLAVTVGADAGDDVPPVLGHYRVSGQALQFEPRFPLTPGVTYRVVLHPAALPKPVADIRPVDQEVTMPALPQRPPTHITQAYPSADVLPENQLKFYLHFSAPMSQGSSYQYIHLLRDDGTEVTWPFLELGEELWDETGTRLTVFIDPGRIKRGLKPREEMGPVLEAGQKYVLAIDADWRDADGRPLESGFRKTFTAATADETQPHPDQWRLTTPQAGSTNPLTIDLGEPLDHAMLQRVLVVYNAQEEPLPGKVAVSDHEAHWSFTPRSPWAAGHYELRVHHTLEDLRGEQHRPSV